MNTKICKVCKKEFSPLNFEKHDKCSKCYHETYIPKEGYCATPGCRNLKSDYAEFHNYCDDCYKDMKYWEERKSNK